ncbi:heterokaryon incompatibility protein-domain-containing protein [Xylaria bambusicola]|uniref:heterokaryon incompatibility protein-domain-containing protein n=1 Tax=Xylaria bambusicola TaxID=326684 RepID=UPI002008B1F9|nr:heterokaryon incompatibility protein-domain-containing protein [Xylaria bambusicola]KAI0509646.1 heterokaryon incompatibility protein-domain-containing protein [Xylaria bambusicola]
MFEFDYDKLHQLSKLFEFKYDQIDSLLGGDHIRVLTLAASDTFTDPIDVSLSTVNLMSLPTYEALSYCWGNASDQGLIWCNGKPFPVTRNLESALRRLRQSRGNRLLWIDAICINQDDLAERAYQVNLMRHIYKNAERVLIWLGEDSEDSELVFPLAEKTVTFWLDLICDSSFRIDEMMMLWQQDSKRILSMKLREARRRKAMTGTEGLQPPQAAGVIYYNSKVDKTEDNYSEGGRQEEEKVEDLTRRELTACMRLVSRPWFTRCWVVQEAVLAREAVVLCGKSSLDWITFYLGVMFIIALRGGLRGRPQTMTRGNIHLTTVLQQKRLVGMIDGKQVDYEDLLKLLWEFQLFDVTDPRDKVFSILGLVDSRETQAEGIVPDYTISVEECYKRTALAIMSYTKNLDLLMTDHNLASKLRSPSWVPDWSIIEPAAVVPIHRYGDRERLAETGFRPYRASTSDYWDIEGKAHGDTLTLSGYIFDTIIALEDILTTTEWDYVALNSINSFNTYMRFLKDFLWALGVHYDRSVMWEKLALTQEYPEYPTGEEPETVFAMIMCAGNINEPKEALSGHRAMNKILRGPKAVNFVRRLGPDSIIYVSLVVILGTIATLYYGLPRNYLTATRAVGRRLARTRKGYLALVPRNSATGDLISLFQGGKVPFVIREMPFGHAYKIIGPSYVHGIMYGEAWNSELSKEISIV